MTVVLHQFIRSHFNEKARWALDYKGVAHTRESYLPGPHMPLIRRLSGQAQTPVLELEGEVVAGSAAIIDRLEARYPDPPLYPADPELLKTALAFAEHFDTEVGPAVRTVIFSALIQDDAFLCQVFGDAKPAWKRAGYRASLPLVRGVIAKGNGVDDPANVERALALTRDTLDDVAKRTADTGRLFGPDFGVGDLTAAALLAPIAAVSHPDMCLPSPRPEAVTTLLGRFADHPAIAWVQETYRQHR